MNLIIHRKGFFPDTLGLYRVYVNDNKVGTLGIRRTLNVPNLSGEVKIVCKINWCTSNELIINADNGIENYHLDVGISNFALHLFLPLTLATFLILVRLEVDTEITDYILTAFMLGALFIVAYNYTLGRKSYLTLNKSEHTYL